MQCMLLKKQFLKRMTVFFFEKVNQIRCYVYCTNPGATHLIKVCHMIIFLKN